MRTLFPPHRCPILKLLPIGLVLLTAASEAFSASPPPWVQSAMATPLSKGAEDADAVVLYDEGNFTYEGNGRIRSHNRYAVRVNALDGRASAGFRRAYNEKSDRFRLLQVWIINPESSPVRLERRDCADVMRGRSNLYSERRMVFYNAEMEVQPGAVFAYEFIVETDTLFAEQDFFFGGKYPVLFSQVTVTTPTGWNIESWVSNQKVVLSGSREGNQWT